MEIYTDCRSFCRREDFDIFSMGDYRSCENCIFMKGNVCSAGPGRLQEKLIKKN